MAGGGGTYGGSVGTIFERDSTGPEYASYSPTQANSSTAISVSANISDDESGVYDDATGSEGQGVYIMWGTSAGSLTNELEMNATNVDGSGNGIYTTTSTITGQDQGTTVYYKIYAYNDAISYITQDGETTESTDYRVQSSSDTQSISVGDEQFLIAVPETIQTAGTAFNVTLTAQESYSGSFETKTDYAGTANISVEYQNPATGTKTVTPASTTSFISGIATVSLTYQDAGSIKIRATDSGDATFTGLSSTAVQFEPSAFTVTINNSGGTESSTLIAGDSFEIVVTAVSSTGATCPNYQGTVSVTTNYVAPTTGTQSISPTSVSITTGGTATYKTAVFSDAQSITATVTETITGTSGSDIIGTAQTGTSGTVVFRPYNFAITLTAPPSSRTRYYINEPFDMTVTAKDKLGNTTKNYLGTMSFTQVSALDLPLTDYKFKASDKGTKTFTDITGDSSGTHTIACNDTTTTTITGSTTTEIMSGRIIILDQSGSTGTITGTLYINNETTNQIVATDDSCIITLTITESSDNSSATLGTSNVTVVNGEATFTVTDTEGETVTVTASSSPSLPVTDGDFVFGSSKQSTFRVLYWREVTTWAPQFDTTGFKFLRRPEKMDFHDLSRGSNLMTDGVSQAHTALQKATLASLEGLIDVNPQHTVDTTMNEGFFRHYLKEGQRDRDAASEAPQESKDTASEDSASDEEEEVEEE